MFSTSECDIEDHTTCDGILNYCVTGYCTIRDCNSEDCSKADFPEWSYSEESIEINSQSGFNLKTGDFINDPT